MSNAFIKGKGRGKPGHAGKLGVDKRGVAKVTISMSTHRQDMLREMAQIEGDISHTSIGSLGEAAIVLLYNLWKSGEIDLDDYWVSIRAIKSDGKLVVEDDFGSDFKRITA